MRNWWGDGAHLSLPQPAGEGGEGPSSKQFDFCRLKRHVFVKSEWLYKQSGARMFETRKFGGTIYISVVRSHTNFGQTLPVYMLVLILRLSAKTCTSMK